MPDPGSITRDGAREEARRELSKPIYKVGEESIVEKVMDRILEWAGERLDEAIRITPGGLPALLLIVLLLVGVAVLVRLGLGPVGLRDALTDRRRGAAARSAAEYRAEAETFAGRGEWKEAVRARFRAVIRELEERGVLDQRPGRTAGEIAREGSAAVPDIGADLGAAAGTFDEAWYGSRTAGPGDYARVRDADERIRASRLVTVTA